MCELFGVSSPERIKLNRLLKTFFSHGDVHCHGWGMAFFYGGAVSLEKSPQCSLKSDYLRQRLCFDVSADLMMAHIRQASKGNMAYENTHPFVERDNRGRTWTLAHNGVIFDSDVLSPYVHRQKGQTDSEWILLYLIDRINEEQNRKGAALSKEERFRVVEDLVREITPENKVNLLIFDGSLMYAHCNLRNTLHVCRKGEGAVFSTRPLDEDRWEPLPLNTLVAYQNGKQKFTGTPHENEFIEDPEKMRLLFLDYAAL